jgi:ankyrin repeat protein
MEAASEGNCEEIRRLVAAGADLEARDSEGDTALCYTVINNLEAATKELLCLGANLLALSSLCPDNEADDRSDQHAFHGACNYTSLPSLRALLKGGIDVNCVCPGSDGSLPLTTVIRSEQDSEAIRDTVQLLMKHGADPHRVDYTGWNTFMWFANYQIDDYDIMRVLAPPRPAPDVLRKAAVKIQGVWRHRSCAKILASMKFRV